MGDQQMQCSQCPFMTNSIRKFKRHMVVAHATQKYNCPLCPFVSCYQSNVYHHKKRIHGIARNFNCNYCNLFVKSSEQLLHHKQTQHPAEYKQEIDLAQMRYVKEINELSGYQNMPFTSVKSSVTARKTGQAGPARSVLSRNKKATPDKMKPQQLNGVVDLNGPKTLQPCRIQRTYQCNQCDLVTRNPRDFLYHSRDVHGEKLNIFECEQCVYASKHFQKLQRHVGFVHAVAKQRKTRTPPSQQAVARKTMKRARSKSPIAVAEPQMNCMNRRPSEESVSAMYDESEFDYSDMLDVEVGEPPDEEILEIIDGEVDDVMDMSGSSAQSFKYRQAFSETDVKCSMCHFKSKSKILVQRHEKVAHLKKKFFKCSKCNFVTQLKAKFNKHMQSHTTPELLCRFCEFKTIHQWILDSHMKIHVNMPAHSCSLCSFASHTKSSLTSHIINFHKDLKSEPIYLDALKRACQSTDIEELSIFVDPKDRTAKDSEQTQHAAPVEIFKTNAKPNKSSYSLNRSAAEFYLKCGKWYRRKLKCQFCAFRTASGSELYEHEEKHYQEGGIALCPLCRQRFPDVTAAKEHVQDKHASALQLTEQQGTAKMQSSPEQAREELPEKPLKCNQCSYEARWMSEMIKHNRIHTQEKPFGCNFCGFRSRWKGDMSRHVQKYHSLQLRQQKQMGLPNDEAFHMNEEEDIDNRTFSIEENGSPGSSTGDFDRFNDGTEDAVNGKENEECGTGRIAIKNEDLEQYAASVEGEVEAIPAAANSKGNSRTLRKRYQCPRCDFCALTASRFHVHMVGHMNQRPFMCSECGYRSNWQWDITKHIRLKVSRKENHIHATLVMLNEYGQKNYEKYNEYVVYEDTSKPDENDNKKITSPKNSSDSLPSGESTSRFFDDNRDLLSMRHAIWKCKSCDFKSNSEKSMLNHLPAHTDNIFFCGDCGHSAKSRSSVERHCRLLHNSVRVIESKANSAAGTSDELMNEEALGNGLDPEGGFVKEGINEAKFYNKDEKGWSQNTEVSPKQHSCNICPYKCKKVFDMRMHMRLHQPQPDAIFKCMFCPFYTSLRRSLMQHMKLHVSEPQEYISQAMENSSMKASETSEVDVLGVDNAAGNSMNTLTGSASVKGMKPPLVGEGEALMFVSVQMKRYSCELCPYTSDSKTQYIYHKQFHRSTKTYSFKCPHCNYSVTKGHLLMQHIKLHKKAESGGSGRRRKMASINKAARKSVESNISAAPVMDFGMDASLAIPPNAAVQKRLGIPLVWVPKGTAMMKMFKCRFCPHVNKRRSNIREHEKMHRKRRLTGKYQCPSCTYVCNNQGVLSAHLKVHQPEASAGSQMKSGFSSASENGSYPSEFDELDVKAGVYGGIGQSIGANAQANGDEANDTIPKRYTKIMKPVYFCDVCPARFIRPCDVDCHKKFHGADLSWKCKHCNYAARHRPHLHRHSKVHCADYQRKTREIKRLQSDPDQTPEELEGGAKERRKVMYKYEKRHNCQLCPAAFLKPSSLAHHLSLHGGKGKFKCTYCNYAVRNVGNLVRHMKIHDPSKAKGFDFTANDILNTQADMLPPDPMPPILTNASPKKELKRFACPKCPAVFLKHARFEIHFRLHASNQRFTCHSCDYSVKFMANLIKHQKIHILPPADNGLAASVPSSPFRASTPIVAASPASLEKSTAFKSVNHVDLSGKAGIVELSQSEQQMVMLLQHQHQMAHQQQLGEDTRRLFFCDRCPYQHTRKDAVFSHLKRHNASQDMVCSYCDYSTTLPSFLRIHTKLHFQARKMHHIDGYLEWDQLDIVAVLPGGVNARIFKDTGNTSSDEEIAIDGMMVDLAEKDTADNDLDDANRADSKSDQEPTGISHGFAPDTCSNEAVTVTPTITKTVLSDVENAYSDEANTMACNLPNSGEDVDVPSESFLVGDEKDVGKRLEDSAITHDNENSEENKTCTFEDKIEASEQMDSDEIKCSSTTSVSGEVVPEEPVTDDLGATPKAVDESVDTEEPKLADQLVDNEKDYGSCCSATPDESTLCEMETNDSGDEENSIEILDDKASKDIIEADAILEGSADFVGEIAEEVVVQTTDVSMDVEESCCTVGELTDNAPMPIEIADNLLEVT